MGIGRHSGKKKDWDRVQKRQKRFKVGDVLHIAEGKSAVVYDPGTSHDLFEERQNPPVGGLGTWQGYVFLRGFTVVTVIDVKYFSHSTHLPMIECFWGTGRGWLCASELKLFVSANA